MPPCRALLEFRRILKPSGVAMFSGKPRACLTYSPNLILRFLLAYVTLDKCMTPDLKAPRKLLALAEIVLGKEPLCNVQYGDPGTKQI